MDAQRFDRLVRVLSCEVSRRRLLAGLTCGLLAGPPLVFGSSTADARKRKRKKRKKTPPVTPAPVGSSPCVRNCANKTCGSDGCGGSCGPCAGGSCPNGTCLCADPRVFCRGECVPGCIGEAMVSPLTCLCCQTGPDCVDDADCCSGFCQPNTGGGNDFCIAKPLGAACDFDAQCTSTVCPPDQCPLHLLAICRDGVCACPAGTEACGGICVPPCPAGTVQIPGECKCCRLNGASCGGATPCCSGNCNTAVVPSECRGLAPDVECTFDEQCASNDCSLGFCI
jgi:hypothetical protein